ncbi:hypothetical protein BUALT_Bualt12G0021900 [Buddleja alternifolia]|uniref:AAA+ ATPase domain-containing protein n=1 Tax=Buddleja alternifolia TaxID=168488 RepID=A0AAV6WUS5_9LAMI|nr:hypothetical protein BUALT_Bualt12G0021900 [Buddleja alternifolia]
MAAVVGIVASLVGPAIELGKLIVTPIKRQFNYLCCFTSNIQSLKDEAEKLNDARAGLQFRVTAAENNVEVILPEVERWLTRANENQIITSGIEAEIANVKKDFLSMKLRCLLSRKAKKTTEATKKLHGECNFNPISQPAPPPAMGPIQIGETYEFETRKKIEEDIMEALRGGEINMLGICGMGGVGKTTMAKRIMKRVRAEDLFDEILMVVVSQPVHMSKIQLGISEYLGLKLEEESLSARAHKLHARLMGTKRTLVVLDDVWEIPKLEELGIPSGVKECRILLTSRNIDVFKAMKVKNFFGLPILSETEASFLFKENVGTCVDGQHLATKAEEVVKECKGLPVALVTVGRALKDKTTQHSWEDALQQLKSSNPKDMPGVLPDVYNPIKLSYKFLDNQHARYVFLLCSLFPEDCDVNLELLTWYIMGLGVLERIRNLGEASNRVRSLVDLLKNRFLLQDGSNEHYVKMHDVVRDVAIFIASGERLVDSNFSSIDWWLEHSDSDCNWTSVFPIERIQLPIVLEVPNLRLLLIHSRYGIGIQMHDYFFEVMKKLNVLSLRNISFKPEALQFLKNLKALNLERCTLESVFVVGQLLNLQILRCHSCYSITELPAEIGRLIHLRLLDFSDCTSLKRVVPGVLSSLVRLEELKMIGSFKGWEADKNGKERRNNASLNELESLSNLTCLEIEIDDCALAAEEICLSSKIVKYDIRFNLRYPPRQFEKRGMYLKWPREIRLGNWIHIFLRSTEFLYLAGDGSNSLDLAQVQEIKMFDFRKCSTVKKLVSTKSIDWRFGVFPVLESLVLEKLPNLEEICDGPIQARSNSFNNLTSIYIWECDKLRNLFPLKMAKDGLSQLKELEIRMCLMMEEVFSNDGEEGHITFPKLKKLSLANLPRLTTFCKGIDCPVLTQMDIIDCPKLASFVSSIGNCNQKVTFGSLQTLDIRGHENISNLWCHKIPPGFFSKLIELNINKCGSIRSLFSSSMVRNLVNLKTLSIRNCNEIVKVIGDDEENVCENSQLIFPSLEELWLRSLPNLVNFCGWRCALQLSSLSNINIYDCPRMESFTMGSLTTPKLERLDVENCKGIEEVFFNVNKYDGKCHVTLFPELKNLSLTCLPNLTTFYKGIESIEFPLLTDMYISCPNLTGFATSSVAGHSDDSFHLFCNQKVTFGSLKKLNIEESNKEDQEDGKHLKVETEEEEMEQAAEENCSSK